MIPVKKFYSGITLVEVTLTAIIIMMSSLGIMKGITFAKSQLLAMEVEENAFEALKQNTEYLRARIAANEIPNSLEQYNTDSICLLINDLGDCVLEGDDWYKIYLDPDHVSGSTARSWVIETKIYWEDHIVKYDVGVYQRHSSLIVPSLNKTHYIQIQTADLQHPVYAA